ncbi:IS5 family transposase (plasmid) [Tritonibacter scottomollicae]|uniref:IS5 family transposase n=1 Tax=Tritonibacter scottomollicae TaxID=483013 RepID=A0ABZ0HMF7_TRISK|nr:IS5 family transposase [Tritonibacter scottomollicae]WOI35463.1 IS5 family transposase [Tritonibacter scottomollicae]
MSDLFWLSDAQMARLERFFPKSRGKPRVDDRRVLSGIIFINRNGLRWRDAPNEYGPHKTLYNRWKRWSDKGIFAQMLVGLAADHREEQTVMIDATYLKAHRTASSLRAKKGGPGDKRGRVIGRTKGGMNTKLHAICDSRGRPLNLFITAGQVSDYVGARALCSSLPTVGWPLGDRGYDADWFREALEDKGIKACIPGRKQRKTPVKYDKRRYKRRNQIEIMFGRLKDWRRVATRYDRSPTVFLSAIALAALVIFWL